MSEPRTPTTRGTGGPEPAAGLDSDLLLAGQSSRGAGSSPSSSAAGDTAASPLRPEPKQASLWSDAWRQLRRSKLFLLAAALLSVLTVMAAFPQLFTSIKRPSEGGCANALANSRKPPGTNGAWFGYDVQGCDYYANVVYGARVSITVGLLVVGGALLIGITLGAIAGFFGGWADNLIARVADVVYGLPLILGAILILYRFTDRGVPEVALALLVLTWMTPMRLVRASVVGVRDSDYVQAARALGASNWRILSRHILPNALAPVLVYGTISVGVIISAEAALSFLGVGLQLPAISWGLMIGVAQNFIRTSLHLLIFPGIFLSVTVLAFIAMGDALRDALDPKLR